MLSVDVAQQTKRSWIEIDEARLAANYRLVREAAGAETDVLAVIKANAYGHGLEQCSVALGRAGTSWLGVADAADGIKVRSALDAAGIARDTTSVLVMCGVFADEVSGIREHNLTPVIWTAGHAELLRGSGARVHVEIDTGMSRQGVRPGAPLDALLRSIAAAGCELDGVMTHFHSAEIVASEQTREQRTRFEAAVEQMRNSGLKPRCIHAGSSSTIDIGEDFDWLEKLAQRANARAMVRSGIALYGYVLPACGAASRIRAELKPVMTWKTRVLDIREIAAGESIGYNATFTARQSMRIALLPVGYADGLRRELSSTNDRSGGWVMLRGADGTLQRAPIIGRISMNLTTIDVTAIDGVHVGDEAILLGDGVTADDHARLAETIAYEILCGVRA